MARLLAVSLVLLNGCALWRLKKDVTRLDELAFVGGHVSRAQDDGAPLVVVLSTVAPPAVVDSFILDRPGPYFFVAPPGVYRVAAFADMNHDLIYQAETEPAAYYGAPNDVPLAPGQKVTDLDVVLEPDAHVRLDFPVSVTNLGQRGSHDLPAIHLGEIVTLDDPRFSAENGKLGLWQPVEFLFRVGGGFYFLQPFDEKKTPVLFVHGAGGGPGDFRPLIEHLDPTRFQPWLLYYPSGLDLDMTARGAARWMETLASRYKFQRLVVVAHSMGGLVARAAINQMVVDGGGDKLAAFVSLSTPWDGHSAAAYSTDAPVMMPMWTDMVPGSPFLEALFASPLPLKCPSYLMFSYRGHALMVEEPNDGVVALSSELDFRAQDAATKIFGFPESHMSILRSAEVSKTLNALLERAVE